MAEWTNLFDLGECVVRVSRRAPDGVQFETLFDGVMTLGDTSTFPWPDREDDLVVSVVSVGSGIGVVRLVGGSDQNPDPGEEFKVDVRLSDPVAHEGSRASIVNLFGKSAPDRFDGANRAYGAIDDGAEPVELQTSEDPEVPELVFVDPDPAVLTNAEGQQNYIGIIAFRVAA